MLRIWCCSPGQQLSFQRMVDAACRLVHFVKFSWNPCRCPWLTLQESHDVIGALNFRIPLGLAARRGGQTWSVEAFQLLLTIAVLHTPTLARFDACPSGFTKASQVCLNSILPAGDGSSSAVVTSLVHTRRQWSTAPKNCQTRPQTVPFRLPQQSPCP